MKSGLASEKKDFFNEWVFSNNISFFFVQSETLLDEEIFSDIVNGPLADQSNETSIDFENFKGVRSCWLSQCAVPWLSSAEN